MDRWVGPRTDRFGWTKAAWTFDEDNADSITRSDRWVSDREKISDDNALFKNYTILVELYKYYLDIAWKSATWYYTTAGLLLAYFFNKADDSTIGPLPLLLAFLSLVSLGMSSLYFRAGHQLEELKRMLEYTAFTLKLVGRPHVEFAVFFLLLNGILYASIGVGSLILFGCYLPDISMS
jgi:hypothetical protein